MYLLPAPKTKSFPKRVKQLVSVFKYKISHQRSRYISAALLDVAFIILIIVFGAAPAKRILPPLVTPFLSIQNLTQAKTTQEVFAFAPGLSAGKYDDVDFEGLTYLSFFDLPIENDGDIDTETDNYASFHSDEASDLFKTAHFFKTKVLITLSRGGNGQVEKILGSDEAQDKLITRAIEEVKEAEIDGVTVNFDYGGEANGSSRKNFSEFVEKLSSRMHQEVPDSVVTVAVANNAPMETGLYDLVKLSRVSDKVLVMAYDFAVPEVKGGKPSNPVFGYKEDEYWAKVSEVINGFSKKIPEKKLALERAWYGNGDRYPLYVPHTGSAEEESVEPAHVLLDSEAVERLVAHVPSRGRDAARENIPFIGKALEDEGILDSNVLAYALATIEHETAETFAPIDEYSGRLHARRFGYEGGTTYFGRGFIQLTHLRNYKVMGERIGMGDALVKDPGLASSPEVAAKVLAAFFKDNNIANLASQGYFVAARTPVNPDRNARKVASLAWKYWEEE